VLEADDLTTFMCRMSWKSGNLNLLEPSGPHRACYGTALPFNICLVRCRWPCGRGRIPAAAWLLGSWVRIPLRARNIRLICSLCAVQLAVSAMSLRGVLPSLFGVSECNLETSSVRWHRAELRLLSHRIQTLV